MGLSAGRLALSQYSFSEHNDIQQHRPKCCDHQGDDRPKAGERGKWCWQDQEQSSCHDNWHWPNLSRGLYLDYALDFRKALIGFVGLVRSLVGNSGVKHVRRHIDSRDFVGDTRMFCVYRRNENHTLLAVQLKPSHMVLLYSHEHALKALQKWPKNTALSRYFSLLNIAHIILHLPDTSQKSHQTPQHLPRIPMSEPFALHPYTPRPQSPQLIPTLPSTPNTHMALEEAMPATHHHALQPPHPPSHHQHS